MTIDVCAVHNMVLYNVVNVVQNVVMYMLLCCTWYGAVRGVVLGAVTVVWGRGLPNLHT
jgi:hypothetical protein